MKINYAKEKNLGAGESSDAIDGGFQQMGSHMPCFSCPSVQRMFAMLNEEIILKSASNGQRQEYDVEFPSLPKKVQFTVPGKNFVSPVPISFSDLQANDVNQKENVWNVVC